MSTFGQYLRLKRIEKKMSQRDLARAAGLTNGAISLIERGERQDLRGTTCRQLAAALDLDAQEVMDHLNPHPATPPRQLAHAG
jgi:transcriptional regulator with XRE-family HTH domain